MKSSAGGFGFSLASAMLIVAGLAIFVACGPCDGLVGTLEDVGSQIGSQQAAEQMQDRDAMEKANAEYFERLNDPDFKAAEIERIKRETEEWSRKHGKH